MGAAGIRCSAKMIWYALSDSNRGPSDQEFCSSYSVAALAQVEDDPAERFFSGTH